MEVPLKRARVESTASALVTCVAFDIGGRIFKVMKHVIMRHPDTLLAILLEDISTKEDEVLFVDANPDRFSYILDWYRFGEMHMKTECVQAVLNDARYFLLPDYVKINGRIHSLKPIAASVEQRWDQQKMEVLSKWPNFENYIRRLADETMARLFSTVDHSSPEILRPLMNVAGNFKDSRGVWHDLSILKPTSGNAPNTCLREQKHGMAWHTVEVATGQDDHGEHDHGFEHSYIRNKKIKWVEPEHICNVARLQVVVRELLALGFECDVDYDKNDFYISLSIGVAVRGHRTQHVSIEGVNVIVEDEASEFERGSLAIAKVLDNSRDENL